ncbi:hypothetical protein [Mycobacterium sp. pW045]|uniref:hypothetical protein n=1 Tax=Mycobacterium sp. pW045 TaxID=3238984 RepID=UPI00351BE240
MNTQQRAEYKRKRNRAIKMMRDAGMSEEDIQNELAKIREDLGITGDSVANLPAVVDTGRDGQTRDSASSQKRIKTPYGGIAPEDRPEGYAAHYEKGYANKPERRCTATNRRGEQCRKFAINGSSVCRTHGGATRHVKNKARVRIEMAANRLVGKELEIAFDDNRPPAVQLDAIKDSLNRAGIVKPTQVEVGPMTSFETVFDDIVSGPPYQDVSHDSMLNDSIGSNYQEPQPDYHTAPAMPASEHVGPVSDGDYAPPASTHSHEQRTARSMHHVTGDDAVRLANVTNARIGALRALPPGRSDR